VLTNEAAANHHLANDPNLPGFVAPIGSLFILGQLEAHATLIIEHPWSHFGAPTVRSLEGESGFLDQAGSFILETRTHDLALVHEVHEG